MIIEIEEKNVKNAAISIWYNDGRKPSINKNTPTAPFDVSGLVSFWEGGALIFVPIHVITKVGVTFDGD